MLSKKFFLLLAAFAALLVLTLALRLLPGLFGAFLPFGQAGVWFLPILVSAALIDSINPCAFSVLLLTIAFLFTLERRRRNILQIGLAYIFGIFAVYVLIGLGILRVLQAFNAPHSAAKIGALLIIAFGLVNLINQFFPKFPIKLKIPKASHGRIAQLMEKASLPAAFALGGAVGLFEFPCTGGPYLAILGLLHDGQTFWPGLFYLLFYNLIFIAPLVVILLLASEQSFMEKVQAWKKSNIGQTSLYGGLAAIAIGVLILLF